MSELIEQFSQLDPTTQLAIMGAVAYGVTAALRALGLKNAPGYQSVVASVLTGAAVGFATTGWPGAVLGALAGLTATGAHQFPKQIGKRMRR